MDEGPKVVTVEQAHGPALVSADIHGNYEDFAALRDLYLAAEARGEDPVWVSVGDWVHGPSPRGRRATLDARNEPLYDYLDRSAEILEELFELMDRFPGRVLSLCGNHEHAHIGGPRTCKFHPDEAAALESRLTAEAIAEMHRRFASWPVIIGLAACGVVVTHGAPRPASPEELARMRFRGGDPAARELLACALERYGFVAGEDLELLCRLSSPDCPPYAVLVHGHDREEEGFAVAGAAALLLCTSFGARRDRKTYLWLDLARRYRSLADIREGYELRRLYSAA